LFDYTHATGFDYLFRLGNANFLHYDTRFTFDHLQLLFLLKSVKGNTGARSSRSGGSTRSVNVGLSIFWWLNLDNQVYGGYVETARSNISGNKNLEFLVFKSFECYFSLILSNISMHNFDLVLNLFR